MVSLHTLASEGEEGEVEVEEAVAVGVGVVEAAHN